MHYTHKDPECCSTTISKCKDPTHCIIRSNPHIFLSTGRSQITKYLVDARCMSADTHPVLSQKPRQDLRIASSTARPDSHCLEHSLGWWVRRLAPFLHFYQKKAHSQSNKVILTVGSPKPPSSFDLTIDLYSAVLSAERFTVADRGELFRISCLWQAVVQSQPIRNVHLCQIRRSAWHLIRGSTRLKS